MCVYRNIKARSCKHCLSGKAIGVTYSECVFVALGIQPVMRMRCVVSLYVACLSTLSQKTTLFFRKKKVIEHKICVLTLSTTLV